MAMLAEKKKREKWCLNPRGNDWSDDKSKFGQRLLEKMGWSAGQGLGVNKQGLTEIVKVRKKDDNKGLGFKENGEEWLKTTSDFNELLDQLGNSLEISGDVTEVATSLEDRSKKSKARVHYHKFTRGKDLSRYSEKDLASIIGPEIIKSKSTVDEMSPNYMSNQINKGSSEEYFNSKKKFNKNQLCEQDDYDKTGVYDHEEEITFSNKKCKKNKKSKEHDELSLPSSEVSSNKIKDPKSIFNGTRQENTVNEFHENFDNVAVEKNKEIADNYCNQQVDVSIKKSKKENYTNNGNLVNEDGDMNVVDKGNEKEFTMDLNQGSNSSSKKKKKRKSCNIEGNNEYTQNKIERYNYSSLDEENKGQADVDTAYASKKKRVKKGSSNGGDNEFSSIQIEQNICECNEMKESENVGLNEESKLSSKKKKNKKNINDDETVVNKIEENADHVFKEQNEEKKKRKSGKTNKNIGSEIDGDHYNSLNIENREKAYEGLYEDPELSSRKKKDIRSNSHNENSSIQIEESSCMDKERKEQGNVSSNEESDISSKKMKIRKSVNYNTNIMNETEESIDYVYKKGKKKRKSGKIDEYQINQIKDVFNSLDVEKKERPNVSINEDTVFSSKIKKKKINNNGVDHENTSSQTVENNSLGKQIKQQSNISLNENSDVSSKNEKNRKSVNHGDTIKEIEDISEYLGKEHKKEKKKKKICEIDENIRNEIEISTDVFYVFESTKESKKKKKKNSLEAKETFSHPEGATPIEHLEPTLRQSKLEKILKKSKATEEANDNVIHSGKLEEQIQESSSSKKKIKKEEMLTEKESETVQNNDTAVMNKQVKTSKESNNEYLEVFNRRTRLRKINIPLKTVQDTKYETSDFMTLNTTDSDLLYEQDETNVSESNKIKIYGILNTHDCNLPKHVVAYEYRLLTDKLKEYNLVAPEIKIIVKDCENISLAQRRKMKQLNKSRYVKTLLPKQDVKKIKKEVKKFAGELKPKIDMIDNLVKVEKKIAELAKDLIEEPDTGSSKEMKLTICLNSCQLETLEMLSKELLLLTNKANDPPAKNYLERKEKDGLAPDVANNTQERVAGKSSGQDAEEEKSQLKNSLQTRIKEKCEVLMEQIKMLKEGKKPPSLDLKDIVPSIKPAENPTNNQAGKNYFNDYQYSYRGRGRDRYGPTMRGSCMRPTFPLCRGAHNSIPYGGWGILKSYNESYSQGRFGLQGAFEGNRESFGQRTLSSRGGSVGYNNSYVRGNYVFRGGFVGKNNCYGRGTYGVRGGFEHSNSFGQMSFGFQGGFRSARDSFRGRHRSEPRGRGRISKNNFDAKQYAEKCKELKTMPELSFKGVDLSKIIPGYASNKTNENSNISNLKVPVDSIKLNELPETNVQIDHSELTSKKESFQTPNKKKNVSSNLVQTSGTLLDVIVEKEKS